MLNPAIILQGKNPSISGALQRGQAHVENMRQAPILRALQQSQVDLNNQKVQSNEKAMEFDSVLEGALQLESFVGGEGDLSPDQKAQAMRFLLDRQQEISARGGNPDDTIQAIDLLQRGDIDGVRAGLNRIKQVAIQTGRMQAPADSSFTLSQGQTRFDSAGNPVATGGPASTTPTNLEKLFELKESLPADDPRRAQVDSAIQKATTRADGTSLTVNPDGTISFTQGDVPSGGLGSGKDLDKKISEQDARQVQSSREAAGKSERSRDLLSRAKELLPEINTGKAAEVTKLMNQAFATFGSEKGEGRAALSEEFDAISKELGAQSLQLFGGSDTEKELEVAIRTNPELNKTNTANEQIIKRKLRAIEVLQSRPDFESQWLQRNGSLVNPDTNTGEYFGRAWRRYQQESFGSQSVSGPQEITSQAQFDALPSGTEYLDGGQLYRKP